MSNYCLEMGIKRLKYFGISEKHDWYADKLIYLDDFPKQEYWNTLPSTNLGYVKIPLNQVIGTSHDDYSNNTWLENFGCLKKCYDHYTKESCKIFFDSGIREGGISYLKYGKDYILTGGNNRTHIARFLGYDFISGIVYEKVFDNELYNTIEGYRRENLPINFGEGNLSRDSLWQVEINEFSFYLNGYENLKLFLSVYKSSKPSWANSTQIAIDKALNNIRGIFHVYHESDFQDKIFKTLPGLKYDKLKSERAAVESK